MYVERFFFWSRVYGRQHTRKLQKKSVQDSLLKKKTEGESTDNISKKEERKKGYLGDTTTRSGNGGSEWTCVDQ